MNNDYWNSLTFIRSVSNLCDVIARSTTDVLRVISTSYSDMVSVSRQSVRLIYDTLSLLELLAWVHARHTRLDLYSFSVGLVRLQHGVRDGDGPEYTRSAERVRRPLICGMMCVASRTARRRRPARSVQNWSVPTYVYLYTMYNTIQIILKNYGAKHRRPAKRSPSASVGIHSHNNIHRNSLYI